MFDLCGFFEVWIKGAGNENSVIENPEESKDGLQSAEWQRSLLKILLVRLLTEARKLLVRRGLHQVLLTSGVATSGVARTDKSLVCTFCANVHLLFSEG